MLFAWRNLQEEAKLNFYSTFTLSFLFLMELLIENYKLSEEFIVLGWAVDNEFLRQLLYGNKCYYFSKFSIDSIISLTVLLNLRRVKSFILSFVLKHFF